MEGSAGAAPAGDAGQAAQGEGEGAGQGLDVSALQETLQSLQGGQDDMRQFLQSTLAAQAQQEAPQEEPGLPELDLSAFDPDQPSYDPNQAAQSLTQYIDQQAQARADALVKEHIDPLREQTETLRRTAEARDLVGEYPELGDEETARNVLGVAEQWAQSIGQPELAANPQVWKLVYLAGRAVDSGNQEGDSPPAAHLEGGGGASPAGGQQGGYTAPDIVNARRGSNALPLG
jgi:hypothetical protein